MKSIKEVVGALTKDLKDSRVSSALKNMASVSEQNIQSKVVNFRNKRMKFDSLLDLGDDTTMDIASKIRSMSIEKRVINIVNDVLGVEASVEDLFDDLYVDSLDLVEIIIECEQEFVYPIDDDKVQNLKTVGDLVNLIKDLDNEDYLESTQADLQVDE